MRKNKINYSLTAKQRKEQRMEAKAKEAEKAKLDKRSEPLPAADETALGNNSEVIAVTQQKTIFGLKPTAFAVIAVCIVLAVALIVIGSLLPTVIIPRVKYGRVNNPVAVIYLSNGETLEFEVYEKEVPTAATNFLYLAKNGYFNGSIIFDRQNNYIRFGGFYDTAYNHREKDEKFSAKFTDITKAPSAKYKFQYRLTADTTNQAKFGQDEGYLSFMQNSSSTEFQICTVSGSPLTASNGEDTRTVNAISFARCLNESVMDKITALYESMENTVAHGSYWKYPTPIVKINKIKLYNMEKSKWDNFNFDEFFKNKISGWTGGSID